MAITIKSAPQASGYVSANEDVWHVVDSTNKNIAGFKYLFDIYKGADLLTRVTNSPYGDDNYGVINVGNIVRSAVAVDTLQDFDMATPYAQFNVSNLGNDFWWGEYDVRYGEICGTTTTTNDASGTYRVYNTYNRHPLHRAAAALSSGTVYLTNRPDESYFYDGEPVVLCFNGIRYGIGTSVDVDLNSGSDGTITISTVDGFHYFILNGLNKDMDVSILSSGFATATKKLKKRCSKYTPYTLVFLNAYGAWDSFTFVNGNVMTDNQKKKFEQMEWKLSGFNMVNKSGKVLYEGMRTYGSEFNTKMKLTTDLLDSGEYIWLFELMVSPLVYLWDKTANLFHPVQITDSNYEIKNGLQNKTETLDINIEVYKQNTQYR
jgi:hypothetical protein